MARTRSGATALVRTHSGVFCIPAERGAEECSRSAGELEPSKRRWKACRIALRQPPAADDAASGVGQDHYEHQARAAEELCTDDCRNGQEIGEDVPDCEQGGGCGSQEE